ncbi:uracil phosphoribosyltransferase [Sulfurospirillum multivorans]|uniref:Uracil phosphoribosyltransferase n=2 Tax=Sulfurospirillum multivorans TaxID=66821 RepID=A0AA86ARE6_SULMK|nr:uracil phosphoribosyltransferase [Sulfurospirillum multivorans]AHJ14383.1 uracil phosphoribosyltransferase [Sulfurospirillum multivorans DSM 12446]QEH07868.1 uracil phosphoribosyltransferase [Sulfurospirillum multivorans]
MKNVHVIKHPLIAHKLSILRDEKTEPFHFRLLVDEISYLMLFEATRDLPLRDVKVQTPVAVANTHKLDVKIMICPILRAALGMLDSVFKLIPDASVGFLGFQRNEKTLEAEFYYAKLPADHTERTAIIIDPMFATGGTAIDAVNFLKGKGVKDIRFLALVSAPEGLKRFGEIHPDVPVFTACVDEGLNENGYIVPGLGDAGDRVFNTLGA